MPNNWQPVGTQNWRNNWLLTSPPKRHTWIKRLAAFCSAPELNGLSSYEAFELHAARLRKKTWILKLTMEKL